MLTRDEQRVLHAGGGFVRVLMGQEPPTGGSSITALGIRGTLDHWTGKGLEFWYITESDPHQLVMRITWAQVRGHGEALSPALRTRLADHLSRTREHQQSFKSYPNQRANPDGWAEADRYFHDVHMPAYRALCAEFAGLLDECYPLAVDHEPTDLLELLEAMA